MLRESTRNQNSQHGSPDVIVNVHSLCSAQDLLYSIKVGNFIVYVANKVVQQQTYYKDPENVMQNPLNAFEQSLLRLQRLTVTVEHARMMIIVQSPPNILMANNLSVQVWHSIKAMIYTEKLSSH